MENYDDHNYYVRFILSQLKWRNELITRDGYFESLSSEQKLYDFSIINASGIRAAGATSAVAELFDPITDLYVGHNDVTCKAMKKTLAENGKNVETFQSLNFNSLNFDNTNLNADDLSRKIGDFFINNNLEVMKYEITETGSYYNKRNQISFNQVDILNIKQNLTNELIYDPSLNYRSDILKVLDNSKKIKNIRVFIDIGAANHRLYGIRVNRLISWLNKRLPADIIYILT